MRVIAITETSNTGLPSNYAKKGLARRCLRVVECETGQKGYLSERGVRLLWESDHYDSRSRGPKSKYAALLAEAERIATQARKALAAGLHGDAPEYMVHDLALENAQ